ncbi:MAG: PDZ domain-containing protein [Actinobacteria bacterium]|nr:MAG: PDZ domain-containing protein [Actinomycetota bacterium]
MRYRVRTLGTLAAAGAVGAAAALSSAGALGALNASTTTVREITAPVTTGEPEAAVFARANAPLSIHDIYVRNAPGVVQVTATTQRALGSGFVLDKAGHIVTNYRVVHGASRVEVSFSDQERLPARIVGRDPSTDLAVLQVRVSSRALTPLRLGNSDLVRVGDSVVAIGNPLGEDRSITSGIVSAIERRIYAPNGAPIDHGIRTDTALDHGSSGGPLLNARGQVIGVTSQIQTGGDGNIGIGFAIPVDTVESVVAQLIANGKVFHPFVGVQARAITPGVSALFRLPARSGLLVSRVCADTGAATAGLRGAKRQVTVAGDTWPLGGDIIVAADGVRVGSVDMLRQVVAQKKPGDTVKLTVLRGDKHLALNVKIAVLIAPPHGPAPLGAGSRIGRRPARPTGA